MFSGKTWPTHLKRVIQVTIPNICASPHDVSGTTQNFFWFQGHYRDKQGALSKVLDEVPVRISAEFPIVITALWLPERASSSRKQTLEHSVVKGTGSAPSPEKTKSTERARPRERKMLTFKVSFRLFFQISCTLVFFK